MRTRNPGLTRRGLFGLMIAACLGLAPGTAAGVERLRFKPGFNLFSLQQDVELGREASKEFDKELPLVTDAEVTHYVSELGRRVATFAPVKSDYPWTFKVVNSKEINAFALPGGFIYINRGAIEAAEHESQIAGVMAHEVGHVVMRHGTHRASQVLLAQLPLAILGGMLGESGSLTGQMAQLGLSFGLNSLLLRNSRGAESQSDQVAAYILYQAGYDPRGMARFFEILQKKYPQRTMEFFSDHPNPGNRIKKVEAIIPALGSPREGKTDSPEFQAMKEKLLGMPAPPKAGAKPQPLAGPPSPPPAPSSRLVKYRAESFAIAYPENWQVQESQDGVSLAPPGGTFSGPQGESAQAYGASILRYRPPDQDRKSWGLIDATQRLVESMRQSNPNLRVIKQTGMTLKGRSALTTLLENDSPVEGQKEKDQLVTVRAGDAVLAIIFVAPESAYDSYKSTFEAMLRSLELR